MVAATGKTGARTFGVMAPTGDRMIFHKADTLAEAQKDLLIGFKVVSELVDGVTVPPLPDGLKHYSFLTSLLVNHGLELREWLAENGCVCRCGDPIRNGGTSDVEAVTHET